MSYGQDSERAYTEADEIALLLGIGEGRVKYLITVRDLFDIPRRGIVLVPDIPRGELPIPLPSYAILVSSSATRRRVEAQFILMHFNPAQRETGYFCVLKNVLKADVEIGSEVWISDDA